MNTDRARALLQNLSERVAALQEAYAGNAIVEAALPLIAQTSAVGLATVGELDAGIKQLEDSATNALDSIATLEQAAGMTRVQ